MTGLLATSGSQFRDWSAAYRLFSKQRVPVAAMFAVVRRDISSQLPEEAPFRAALDDTLLRRAGLHIPGVAWRRDPLGPRFQTNFVRGQRFLQVSAAMPGVDGVYRLAPVAFLHTPTPKKLTSKATDEEKKQYLVDVAASRLSVRGAEQMIQLRLALNADDKDKLPKRHLLLAFDGAYTNATVLKKIPANTTCIGRIRKDAKLFLPPNPDRKKRGAGLFSTAFPLLLPTNSAPMIRNPGQKSRSLIPGSRTSYDTSGSRTSCGALPAATNSCKSW